jgi:hypothetical protein
MSPPSVSNRSLALALACALSVCLPVADGAFEGARADAVPAGGPGAATLSARFIPMRLGRRTTLEFGFSFSSPPGQVPPPLTQVELRYPNDLGLGLSGLGIATCTAQTLEAHGPGGCPANAAMGFGAAFTGVVLGDTIVTERAPIAIMRAPDRAGRMTLLFSSEGTTPVDTRIVFAGILQPAAVPFGGRVEIGIPLVPTLPGAPYISVISLHSTIGPRRVVYYEQVDGRTLAYRPLGILLPDRCPRGGFQFEAQFGFEDASLRTAHTSIPCPKRHRRAPVRRLRHP